MRDKDEVAVTPGGEFVQEVHQRGLRDPPIGHILHGFCPDDHIHHDSVEGGEGIDDEDGAVGPGIDGAEGLFRALVVEVVEDRVEVEHLIVFGTVDVLHLRKAREVEFPDFVGRLLELVEPLGFGLEVMPMQVRRDGFVVIDVGPDEGFEAGFEEKGEDLQARGGEGFDGVGFPGAGRAHEHDVEAGVRGVDGERFCGFGHDLAFGVLKIERQKIWARSGPI